MWGWWAGVCVCVCAWMAAIDHLAERSPEQDSPLRKDSDTRDSANIQLFKWVDGKAQEPIMANVQMATASKV